MLPFAEKIISVYEGNNWTSVCIAETIADITLNEAIMKTPASPNTIASLLNHLMYWNEIIMLRMKGEEPVIPDSNGFDVRLLNNDEDWQQLIHDVHQSFIELADEVRAFPEEKLLDETNNGISTFQENFHGIAEHAYYHLGQIVILKHLVKNK